MKTRTENPWFGTGSSRSEWLEIPWFRNGWLPTILGLVALLWPNQTIQVLVSLIAVFLIYNGSSRLLSSFRTSISRRLPSSRLESVPESLLSIALGLTGLLWPNVSALAALYLVAVLTIGTGLIAFIGGFALKLFIPGGSRIGFPGVLPIIFGLLLLIFPGLAAVAIVRLIGLYAVGSGVMRLLQPQATQRLEHETSKTFGEISRAL
jgi:uncharacterized membrane protein HdeD (DUF308 family)